MSIHYDRKSGRFRDDAGHWVSKTRALKSATARKEFAKATAPRQRAPRPAPPPPPAPPPKRQRKAPPPPPPPPPKPARKRRAPPAGRARRDEDDDQGDDGDSSREFVPPWEREEIQPEYPDDWFPDDYGYDDFIDDWGDFDDEETDS